MHDPLRSLDTEQEWIDWMTEYLGAKQEGFQVKDVGAADWCLANKAKALARMEETRQQYAVFVERYASWRDQRNREDQATIERMESLLRPYFDQLKADGKIPHKKKSMNLPSGTIGERWRDVEWDRNEKELFPWAKANQLTRSKEECRWDEIKKHITMSMDGLSAVIIREVMNQETGEVTLIEEVVPGVRVKQLPGNIFYVECPKEEKTDGIDH